MNRILTALALAALSTPALANAALTEFAGGGLVFKEATDIAIAREDLYLSLNKITVHYDYQSGAADTLRATVGFPMPPVPIDGGPDDPSSMPDLEGSDLTNYMLFSAKVNGVAVETTLHQFAWFEGENITDDLAAAGIPVFPQYDQTEEIFAKVDPAVVDALEARGIISRDEERTYVVPNWSYQTVYEWQQDFAPGMTQVDIEYRPLAGYPGDIGDVYETDEEGTFCVDNKVRATIAAYREKNIPYEVGTLGYITTTAQYWKGPIGEFNLTIAKDPVDAEYSEGGDETSFCGKADFTESPTDFKWSTTDFVPEKDISIVFYSFFDYGFSDEEEPEDETVLDKLQ